MGHSAETATEGWFHRFGSNFSRQVVISLPSPWQDWSVMAVTDTPDKTEPSQTQDASDRDSEREEDRGREATGHQDREREGSAQEPQRAREARGSAEEPDATDANEEEPEGSGPGKSKKAAKRDRVKGIAGGIGIFLILGLYFVWIGNEMGSHAISGTSEMWAIFGAIFLGVLALVAGGAISRKKQQDDDE